MKRISTLALVVALALTGCTTVKTVDLSDPSAAGETTLYTITLADGQQHEVLNLHVQDDSTSWTHPKTGNAEVVANTQIGTISCEISPGQRAILWRRTHPTEPIPAIDPHDMLALAPDPHSFARINRLAQTKKATVTLADNRTVTVDRLQVTADSTSWWRQDRFETVATAAIREIHFDKTGKGMLVGTLTGLVSGAALGVLVSRGAGYKKVKGGCREVSVPICRDPEFCWFGCHRICWPAACTSWSYREERVIVDGAGAFAGAALGGLMGMLISKESRAKDIYRFEAPAPAPSAVTEEAKQ